MQANTNQKSAVMRLGDLLLESGYVSESELMRAVEMARKNFQSLGKVIVSTKICTEQDVKSALDVQKLCKLEKMTGSLAVRTLTLMKKEALTLAEVLKQLGWTSEIQQQYKEPPELAAARQELDALGGARGIIYGQALEKAGDAYLKSKLSARAEAKYEEARAVYESELPGAAAALARVLSKLGRLAIQDHRHREAGIFLEMAKAELEKAGLRQSREYVQFLLDAAEYYVSRRKYTDAEQHYRDSFDALSAHCQLEDEQVLGIVRRYVEAAAQNKREQPETVTLGDLFRGSQLLGEGDLTKGFQESKQSKLALGRALVTLGLVTEMQLQLALQAQMMVRNNEITALLAIWIVRYAYTLDRDLDSVLELFGCRLDHRNLLSGELRSATNEMTNMESRLSANHPNMALSHAKVAGIYFKRQQFMEADQHFRRAITIFSANPGAPIDKALEIIDQYSDLKAAMEDLEESVRISKIALQMRQKHFGKSSIPYAVGLEKLAALYQSRGEHWQAIPCLNEALSEKEKLFGPDDRQLVSCLEARGESMVQILDLIEAEASFDRALEIAEQEYGQGHEILERIRKKLARVCHDSGNFEKARRLLPGNLVDTFLI